MTKILVRRHSTLIVTSTTPSPWRRRDTRGCIQGWVQAGVRVRQRSSTTPTTSGCRSCFSSRQHHSTCPTFCTNSPTTTESPIWSRTYRTRNHLMKSEMTNLETSTFICRLTIDFNINFEMKFTRSRTFMEVMAPGHLSLCSVTSWILSIWFSTFCFCTGI